MTIAGDDELQLTAAQVRAILADRAQKLARSYDQVQISTERLLQLIAFGRGEHHYGVELMYLTEIRPVTSLTRVPGVPPHFSGVIQLRGEIVAVIDISAFGGMPIAADEERFAVVVAFGDVGRTDRRHGRRRDRSARRPNPPTPGRRSRSRGSATFAGSPKTAWRFSTSRDSSATSGSASITRR